MHSYVTLCPPLLLLMPHSSFSVSLSLYLFMHWDFVDRLVRESPLRKQDSVFRGSIAKIHFQACQLKCKGTNETGSLPVETCSFSQFDTSYILRKPNILFHKGVSNTFAKKGKTSFRPRIIIFYMI